MKAIIFLSLVLLATSFILDQSIRSPKSKDFQVSSTKSVSGFPQYIGFNFGEEKVDTLIKFINSAASFYRDDLEKNLKYIQANMQIAYGKGNETFGVIIQTNSTSSVTSTYFFSKWGNTFACFAAGISSINPTWSYLIYIIEKDESWIVEYAPPLGQGKDINADTITAFKNSISKWEGTKCKCKDLDALEVDLANYDGQDWNIICHSGPVTAGYVPMIGHQWISFKPGVCHYLLYPVIR